MTEFKPLRHNAERKKAKNGDSMFYLRESSQYTERANFINKHWRVFDRSIYIDLIRTFKGLTLIN